MKKNKEQLRYLPAIISLSAGLIISIVMIINRKRTLTSLIVVLSFLLGFYIIGSLFRVVLIAMATKETDTEEDNNETAAENVDGVQESFLSFLSRNFSESNMMRRRRCSESILSGLSADSAGKICG